MFTVPLVTSFSCFKAFNWERTFKRLLNWAIYRKDCFCLWDSVKKFRRSHWRCSTKKDVLKNFAIFTKMHLCWSLFIIKLQAFRTAILLKETPTQMFFCKYLEILKNIFFTEYLWWLILNFLLESHNRKSFRYIAQ